jgi:hypothetical protein
MRPFVSQQVILPVECTGTRAITPFDRTGVFAPAAMRSLVSLTQPFCSEAFIAVAAFERCLLPLGASVFVRFVRRLMLG